MFFLSPGMRCARFLSMKTLVLAIATTLAFSLSSSFAEGPQVFEDSDAQQGLTLNNTKLTVAGSNNTLVILGTSPALVVTGSGNNIKIQSVDQIEIAGSNNTIVWSSGATQDLPKITDQGSGNKISSGSVTADDM